jgi:VWFA-related protein
MTAPEEGSMSVRSAPVALGLTVLGAVLMQAPAGTQQQQPPAFRSGVELVSVDVQVVDKRGQPITGLKPEQFEVNIDGRKRQVVSAQLIDSATGTLHPSNPPALDGAGGPAAKQINAGNLYVMAIDQGSFRAVNAPSASHAVKEFIKRLTLNDYLGLVSYPQPGVVIDPTRERGTVNEAVSRIVGFTALKARQQFQFTLSDAIDASSRDRDALKRVVDRNCQPGDQFCPNQVEMEMTESISTLEMQAVRSLDGLRGVVKMVGALEGRKILVVVSAGIPTGDRTGGRLYMRTHAMEVGKEAAAAGVLVYTLHLNTSFLDAFSPQAGSVSQTLMRETGVYARGLDLFNGSAGGTLMEVNAGPDFAIERMMRETSAYYLLGVQPEEADRDGRSHAINVRVSQRESNVRNRRSVVIPKPS